MKSSILIPGRLLTGQKATPRSLNETPLVLASGSRDWRNGNFANGGISRVWLRQQDGRAALSYSGGWPLALTQIFSYTSAEENQVDGFAFGSAGGVLEARLLTWDGMALHTAAIGNYDHAVDGPSRFFEFSEAIPASVEVRFLVLRVGALPLWASVDFFLRHPFV